MAKFYQCRQAFIDFGMRLFILQASPDISLHVRVHQNGQYSDFSTEKGKQATSRFCAQLEQVWDLHYKEDGSQEPCLIAFHILDKRGLQVLISTFHYALEANWATNAVYVMPMARNVPRELLASIVRIPPVELYPEAVGALTVKVLNFDKHPAIGWVLSHCLFNEVGQVLVRLLNDDQFNCNGIRGWLRSPDEPICQFNWTAASISSIPPDMALVWEGVYLRELPSEQGYPHLSFCMTGTSGENLMTGISLHLHPNPIYFQIVEQTEPQLRSQLGIMELDNYHFAPATQVYPLLGPLLHTASK